MTTLLPSLIERLGRLTTPHRADACLRTRAPVRCGPAGLRAIAPGMRCAGRARPARHVGRAEAIRDTEREQARRMRDGTSFREQSRFDEYIARRAADPRLGFREHLRSVGKAIEE